MIASCASVPEVDTWKPEISDGKIQQWNYMVGSWYSDQPTKSGERKETTANLLSDGSYIINFKKTSAEGEVTNKTEVGYWGISGDIHFTIFKGWIENEVVKLARPTDPYNYDAYKIIELTETTFKYVHVDTGDEFHAKKIKTSKESPYNK